MKILSAIFITALPLGLFAQTGNHLPVNSYEKLSFENAGFLVKDYYIPLDGNINNDRSAMYLSKKPGMDDVLKAATTFKTDSFTVEKDKKVLYSIILHIDPSSSYFAVTNISTGKQRNFPCKFDGVISANRAIEITGKRYDKNGSVVDGILNFNSAQYKIVSNKEIETTITGILNNNKL
ncbi:hypothetical protein ACEN9X_24690 [Mucilaginibacter sp. Mucisp86]|uniref:hypothetical protein n=1 Tax=Mucilaginibacter sp. Mucisp86 TaxID=3243060 RepID=UPI0039B5C2D0